MVYEKYGPPSVLQLKEIDRPEPKDNEVLIKVCAASVTAGDCEARSFTFPPLFWLPLRLLFGIFKPRFKVLGQELSGEVVSVGKEVTRFEKGDFVFGPSGIGFGAYAQYKCMREDEVLASKPVNMTFEEAATVPTGGLNALYFLRKGKIQEGEHILINGAAGSIGNYAVQLAKYFGAKVTAVDSSEKLSMLRLIGADHVIDYQKEDFTKNGKKYDLIFDVADTTSYSSCIQSLKPEGRYILASPSLIKMIRGFLTSLISKKKVKTGLARYNNQDLNYLKNLVEAGQLKSIIDKQYPFEQLALAHQYVESGHKTGNVAISIGQSQQSDDEEKPVLEGTFISPLWLGL